KASLGCVREYSCPVALSGPAVRAPRNCATQRHVRRSYCARRRRTTLAPSCQCQLTISSFDASDCCFGTSGGTIFTVSTEVFGEASSEDRDGSRSPFGRGFAAPVRS